MVCRTVVTSRFICTLALGLGAILCPFCSGEGADGSFRANISQSEPDAAAKNPPVSPETATNKVVDKAHDGSTVEIASLESQPVGGTRQSTDSLLDIRKDLPKKNADIKKTSTWWVFMSLSLVLALIAGTAYLLRRFLPGSQRVGRSSAIEILSRSVINPKQSLCLVRLGNKLLLVGLSPNHMSCLANIDEPEEIAQISGLLEKDSIHSISNTFGRLFHKESQGYDIDVDVDEKTAQSDRSPEADEQGDWREAKSELSELVDKVKGLAKMKFR
jgi:flagellar biosynthetic protein FliO